jgi:hypothetical protein
VEGRFNANVATPIGTVSLTPHVSLCWQHEYLDSSRGVDAQFIGTGGGSFVTTTDNPDRDAAFIDAGLDATVCKNVTVFVDYETQAGQSKHRPVRPGRRENRVLKKPVKLILFSRKATLRAIHAGCVALFLLAATPQSHAHLVTNPFVEVSGTTGNPQRAALPGELLTAALPTIR